MFLSMMAMPVFLKIDTTIGSSDDDSTVDYDTDKEFQPLNDPPVLSHNQDKLDVDLSKLDNDSNLPLVAVLNCRSAYNKRDSLRTLLHSISPDFLLASETWSREDLPVQQLLNPTPYTAVGFSRKKVGKNQPGGGCAIIFNESKFFANLADTFVPEGIEGIWRLATARDNSAKVGKICSWLLLYKPKI